MGKFYSLLPDKRKNLWPFRDVFVNNWYDELEVIAAVTAGGLKELEITLPGHVRKILMKTARVFATAALLHCLRKRLVF